MHHAPCMHVHMDSLRAVVNYPPTSVGGWDALFKISNVPLKSGKNPEKKEVGAANGIIRSQEAQSEQEYCTICSNSRRNLLSSYQCLVR